MSSGNVKNSAEHAAIAEAAKDLCSGSGGPVGGGLIFLFNFLAFSDLRSSIRFHSDTIFFVLSPSLLCPALVLGRPGVQQTVVAQRHWEALLLPLLLLLLF